MKAILKEPVFVFQYTDKDKIQELINHLGGDSLISFYEEELVLDFYTYEVVIPKYYYLVVEYNNKYVAYNPKQFKDKYKII